MIMAQRRTKSIPKRGIVVAALRQRIMDGALAPGSQLPSRDELVANFAVSPVTAQKAVERLKQDGYVYGRQGAGVFVVDHPPHLTNYALAFPTSVEDPDYWTRFTMALRNEALRLEGERSCKMMLHYGVDEPEANAARRALEEDVVHHRVAGVILTRLPYSLAASPILAAPDVPRVVLVSSPVSTMPAVFPDYTSFAVKAFDYLTGLGRRRIAIVVNAMSGSVAEVLEAEGQRRRLASRPWWLQRAAVHPPEAVRDQVHLLMRMAKHDGIDGLIIADDNLIEGATAGLLAAGVTVGEELDAVAHCNFPWPVVSPVPVTRLGFDVTEILRTCMGLIDAQRRGDTVAALTLIPARFEQERLPGAESRNHRPRANMQKPNRQAVESR